MKVSQKADVIIIGGSYAGLSAAMTLGRSLRNIVVVDSGTPCNRQTPHSHNFLTRDGETPSRISDIARDQVRLYPTVTLLEDLAVGGKQTAGGFEITTQTGEIIPARKLIFATGIRDIMPDITGFASCWGISVIHCPYCHGYEYRQRKTGIMANGDQAFHLASMVRNLTQEVTIFTNGEANFSPLQLEKLEKHSIRVVEKRIEEIVHEGGNIRRVLLDDGGQAELNALYAALPFEQHCAIPMSLGCRLDERGYLVTNNLQKTSVDGVFACGDNSATMRSVAGAVYSGNIAGAAANLELVHDAF